jgi:hypothetical protein
MGYVFGPSPKKLERWLDARALARTTTPLPSGRRRLSTPEHPPSALAHKSSFPSINRVKALHHADFSAGDISKKEDVPTYTIAIDFRGKAFCVTRVSGKNYAMRPT